jgi:dihydrofolate reductase
MRKVVVSEFISLDGVIEDPGGSEQFQHGGWTRPYWDDAIGKVKFDELFAADVMLLGRKTYEGFAKAWPTMTDTGEFGVRMNGMAKLVVTSTLETLEWSNSRVLEGDLVEAVTRLKQQPGQDILVAGSASVAQALAKHDLVDEYTLLVYPVVVGSGKRLFGDAGLKKLRLVETRSYASGVVLVRYQGDKG